MSDPGASPDERYARGEITREEWMRQRASAPTAPAQAGPQGPRRGPRSGPTGMIFLLIVAVVALAVVAAFLVSSLPPGFSAWSPTYATPTRLQASDLTALNASATPGRAFTGNNTLWFGSGPMSMVVYGSPAAHDMAFVIQGMVNPTIHVPAGAHVTVTMVNMDSGEYHTWSLTAQPPPYSSSGMMGGGMMSGTMMGTSMLSPMSSAGMWSQQMGMTPQAGSYWYVCAVSTHAASGMYGQFVVG